MTEEAMINTVKCLCLDVRDGVLTPLQAGEAFRIMLKKSDTGLDYIMAIEQVVKNKTGRRLPAMADT